MMGARMAVTLAAAVLIGRGASAGVVVIDPAAAGADLGAAVNRALAEAPGVLLPDASVGPAPGSLIEPLQPNGKARAVPKKATSLASGDYSVVVTGVAEDGTEVAVGEPLRATVGADEVLEVVVPAAATESGVVTYSVYAGPLGNETLQAQELPPEATIRLIDGTEFFNRRRGEVPYYRGGPGPPVAVRIVVGAYVGDRLVRLGGVQKLSLRSKQSVRVTMPKTPDLSYGVFAASGPGPERLQARGLTPGASSVLSKLRKDGDPLPSGALRIEIAPGDYTQASMIVIDRPQVTLVCQTPSEIRVTHRFDQSAVLVNPSILSSASADNVGIHRLRDVVVEGCTWDMSGQIETATEPAPDDFRNFAVMAWATDGLTLRNLRLRNNLRGGLGTLSCSDVRLEDNRIERNRGRAQSDDEGRLLPGRGVGNAINVARNAPFSDPVGDWRQTRTVIAGNIVVGDDYGEMYGIVAAAGGAAENTITGNTVSHLRGPCIALEGQNARDSGRTTISGNTCTDTGGIESDNASGGLADSEMRDVTISGNTVSANRAAGIAVSSSNTAVVGNVIDGCHLGSSESGCILITPPRPSGAAGEHAGTRNLLVADNVISLGKGSRSQPPVGVYVNGPVPIRHLSISHNRIDCERTARSDGVQISGDVADIVLSGNDISDCGGDGVVITDFSMVKVKVPQRLTATGNVFRDLNLSDRWMDGRHPVGAAFRFMIDGIGTTSSGHRLRHNQVTDSHVPPLLRYGVIFDAERPGAINDVRLEGNEWNARTDDVYKTGVTDLVVR